PLARADKAEQKYFASPDQAVAAMVSAVRADDAGQLRQILGRGGEKLINSGDTVADQRRRKEFAAQYDTANKVRLDGDSRATLLVGKDEWPMPVPLMKSAEGWRFDARQGSEEILKRRIGKNELAAMEVVRAIVDAQREYVATDQDRNGLLEYAPKLVSAPGKRDGLYWETTASEPQSPLGPLVAAAAKDGYATLAAMPLEPYHGYFYRILARQGKDAPGGAYDYLVRGKMIGGFAVVAYPARYGASGIMTFMVNHDGVVFEKDLGKNTAALAEKMTSFDPTATWKRP
ncbi:MAG: DUF2950 domain-containing protein, partial [Usitatibacteraceae bacterium]